MRPIDLDSDLDVPESLPGGATWWTRCTATSVMHVLELPERADGTALELAFLGAVDGRTTWLWRDATGAALARVEGARA